MIYGYARVSTQDQSLESQLIEFKKCDVIFSEKASGVKDRPELTKLLNIVKPGDSIIVYRLDRLGRTAREMLNLVYDLNIKKVNLISISEKIDTSTPEGKLTFTFMRGISEFERDLTVQRVKQGLKAAKERGVKLGAPVKYDKSTIKQVHKLKKQKFKVQFISEKLNIPKSSVYHILKG